MERKTEGAKNAHNRGNDRPHADRQRHAKTGPAKPHGAQAPHAREPRVFHTDQLQKELGQGHDKKHVPVKPGQHRPAPADAGRKQRQGVPRFDRRGRDRGPREQGAMPAQTEQPLAPSRPMGTVHNISSTKKKGVKEAKKNVVKFAALGGLEEIGRNMSFFEYNDQIVIFDAGLEFPGSDNPGVDYIIPNTAYLQENRHKIVGMVITHAHYDHIGAIPHIMEKLGNPVIYTTALTREIIKKRQDDYPNVPKPVFEIVKNRDVIQLSPDIAVEFFNIIHSIPDSISAVVRTPVGNFMYAGDVKLEYDEHGHDHGLEEFKRAAAQGIHTLFLESTNSEVQGKSLSTEAILDNIDKIFQKAEGRLIIAMFASMLTRVGEVIALAEKHGRKVAFSGLSMKTNVQIAQNLGYIKIKQGTVIPLDDIHKYKDDKVLILSTGAQGESNASLMKIATGEHRSVRIKPGDTIAFSSSIIPGNERAVQTLKDSLARQGAIIYHSKNAEIYASGHATAAELAQIIETVKPKFYVPIHGYYFHRSANAEIARECGIPRNNSIVVDNGLVIEFEKDRFEVDMDHPIPAYYVMVDGLGVGDVGEIVMRDRKMLAEEGMVVIIATMDKRTGNFIKSPDIISRGFIYLKENKEIVEEMRKKIKGLVAQMPTHRDVELDYLKGLLRDQIGLFLYNKTKRRPMVLPVIIEV